MITTRAPDGANKSFCASCLHFQQNIIISHISFNTLSLFPNSALSNCFRLKEVCWLQAKNVWDHFKRTGKSQNFNFLNLNKENASPLTKKGSSTGEVVNNSPPSPLNVLFERLVPLRHMIRVMRIHDLTNKKTKTKTKTKTVLHS